jgi:AraC-like DNA-binding protein
MALFVREPGPPLAQFVNVIWLSQGHVPGPHRRERVLPAGDCALIVDLADPRGYAGVSGPHSRGFEIDVAAQFALGGVAFKPGGAYPFFDVPLHTLADDFVALGDVWGCLATELRERVLEAPTPDLKFAAFEDVLKRRLARAPDRHPGVVYAIAAFERAPGASVIEVAGRTGMSHRRFLDLFDSEVGLTPKVFCRILRFQRVLRRVDTGRDVDWTDVALSCGYYDQAHFIHDFQVFAGMTPTMYEQRRVSMRHVAVLD